VQPVEAAQPGGGENVAHRLRREAELGDVDRLVQAPQAEPVGLALVQRGAERRPDPGPDEAEQVAAVRHDPTISRGRTGVPVRGAPRSRAASAPDSRRARVSLLAY